MSIELVTFCVGLSIGICLSAVLMVLERLKAELDDDIYRLNITRDIQELKAEVEELKNDSQVIRYRCDRSMAIKKRVIFTCDRKCQNCLCALAKDEYGHEHHVGQSSGGVCGNITRRNFEVMNHDGQVAADRFDRQRDDRHKVDWRFDGRRNR